MTHPANLTPWHLYDEFPAYNLFIDDLATVSEANKTGEHWSKKSHRHKKQRVLLLLHLKSYHILLHTPSHIQFRRYAPRDLDADNLVMAFKHLKDAFCDYFMPGLAPGRADAKLDVTFSYDQIKSKRKGVEITIYGPKH